ncbi:hypothetical protein FUA26_00460 [Seonamhaeicola algicola]|uniref:Carboxypeptidase-like regulatory domain-containing protein n=1 Tax=Seonamhaeicola algicola TaxID=1719036 RepID=A0A5C7B537_9FLAO|nr:carboxypeptidase-like regulatory domain-containing protein [Seonamhaeicola algicola]TXE15013.1 hypothetical protein FUA26_00460 [Seonamhaeicola algicola]
MKHQLNLNINKPCSENFNKFDKTDKGGFCKNCQKEVVDFREMTATELVKFFEKNKNNTCGILKISQMKTLNKTSIVPKKYTFNYAKLLGLACFWLFAFQNITAQKITKTQTNSLKVVQNELLAGVVLDHDNLPLPGVSIVLKGTKIGVTTDFEGKFTFPKPLKANDVLVFSYLGYSPKRVKVAENQKNLNVTMDAELVELMGAVSTNKVYTSKRNKN